MNKIACVLKNTIPSPKDAKSFTLTPDGNKVYIGCKNGNVELLDLSTSHIVTVVKMEKSDVSHVTTIGMSSNGKWLIAGSRREIIKACTDDMSNPRRIFDDDEHQNVCISDCGSVCAFVSLRERGYGEADEWILYLNITKGEKSTSRVLICCDEMINSVVIDKAGSRILASFGCSGEIMIFSAKDDWSHIENTRTYGKMMVLKETGTLLVNTVKPASLITWSGVNFSVRECKFDLDDDNNVKSIATSRDAKTIMVASDECIEVYRPMCQTLQLKEEGGDGYMINAALSMDGSKIVTLRSDGYIRVYSIADQSPTVSDVNENRKRVLEAAANLLTELAKSMDTKKQKWGE